MADTAKRSSPSLFTERMDREGRLEEFRKRVRERQERYGELFHKARNAVMKEMGWEGVAKERELAEKAKQERKAGALRMNIKAEQDAIREEQRIGEFSEAVKTLPDKAPAGDEMDWIRAHPAMGRRSRQGDGSPVVISAEDVLYPSHGPAPSKAAVYALQNWANNPQEFYKQLLTEHKKRTEQDGGRSMDSDQDLDEVEALLKQVIA